MKNLVANEVVNNEVVNNVTNEVIEAITLPQSKEIEVPLLDKLKAEILAFISEGNILNLEFKKLELSNLVDNKQIKSKDKNELRKLINKALIGFKLEVKEAVLIEKQSKQKPLTNKQEYVKNVSEQTRSLSSIIKGTKAVNKGNFRYSFLYKKYFTLSVVNGYFTLSQFNHLLTKGNFFTESSIISILDKIEKLEAVEYNAKELRGKQVTEIYNNYNLGLITFSEAIKQFNGLN